MMWIGLTGGIATGKSTVANLLRDLGHPVVDADALAYKITLPGTVGLTKVVEAFGQGIITKSGELNRAALGEIVFSDEKKRLDLEKILHPIIQAERARERRQLEQNGVELAFYDVPLLFEKNMQGEFDATVLVYAPQDEQMKRLKERNCFTQNQIASRLKAQMPIDEKRNLATYIIDNSGSVVELKNQVDKVVQELLHN